jgi:hypothetical protein
MRRDVEPGKSPEETKFSPQAKLSPQDIKSLPVVSSEEETNNLRA